jgi:hypothetical protein
MPGELLATLSGLAASAATAIVQAAATEMWETVRDRIATVLGRDDDARVSAQALLLDRVPVALQEAPPAERAAMVAAQRERVQDMLIQAMLQDQLIAERLAIVVDELELLPAPAGGNSAGDVHQSSIALGNAQQAVQGHGDQHNRFGGTGSATDR